MKNEIRKLHLEKKKEREREDKERNRDQKIFGSLEIKQKVLSLKVIKSSGIKTFLFINDSNQFNQVNLLVQVVQYKKTRNFGRHQ